jgi:hypothetical protein
VPWFLRVLFFMTCAALGGAVVGIVLLFLERPGLARRLAKRATLLAVVVLAVVVAELQVLWTPAGSVEPLFLRALPAGDPSTRARALAQGISDIIHCAALAIPAVVLGAIGWIVARGQLRRSSAEARPQRRA